MLTTKLEAKIVTEKEWEQLISSNPRYEYVTDENMGFADPQHGKAFVRQTYWPELNKYLLRHEFEHLLEEKGTEEDKHGIRHKKGFLRNAAAILPAPFTLGSSLLVGSDKQRPVVGSPGGVLNRIANPVYQYGLPIVGSVLGAPLGPLGSAGGAALGSAVGNAATGQRGIGRSALTAGASGGAGNLLGQGLSRFFGPSSTTPGLSNPQTGLSQTNLSGQSSSLLSPNRPVGGGSLGQDFHLAGAGGSSPSGPLSLLRLPGMGGLNPFGPPPLGPVGTAGGPAGAPTAPPPPPPPGPGGLGNFLSSVGKGLTTGVPMGLGQSIGQGVGQQLGGFNARDLAQLTAAAGALGVGQFSRSGQVPTPQDLTQLPRVQNIEQTAGKGLPVSPAGQLGQQDLMARLRAPFQGVNPQVLQSIRDSFDRQRRDFASQFKTIRPNADIASDADYARNLTLLDRQEAQAIGDVQQQEFARFQAERTNDISTALGIDNRTLGTLMDVAQLDVDRIQDQFKITAVQALQFKNTFGQIAAMLAARPLGLTSFGP